MPTPVTEFQKMLKTVIEDMDIEQKVAAEGIGCSPQYLCDLIKGNRQPSVEITNKICTWLCRGPAGRKVWHIAAAKANGWEV